MPTRIASTCVLGLAACAFLFAALATFCTASAQLFEPPAGPVEQEVDRLLGVLNSDSSIFEKQQACKRLAYLGDQRAVPAAAELLGDERLSHYARYVLEAIADPSADEALRDALSKVEDRQLVGVINSIGVRRDPEAVPRLGRLLNHPKDGQVAAAAAAALAEIATAEAVELLAQATAQPRQEAYQTAFREASLRGAERLVERNQTTAARRIYRSLFTEDAPRHVRVAAALGVLETEPEDTAAERFAEFLNSGDDVKFEAAVYAAPERPDRGVTRALTAALERAPAAQQVQLLAALRLRQDADVVAPIAAVYEEGSAEVKMAALRSLGQVGDRRSVPLLIAAATDFDSRVAATAVDSLTKLDGEQVDEALLAHLTASNGPQQRVVATILGRRGAMAAEPALLRLVNADEQPTRVAALEALGHTISADNFGKLLDRVPAAQSDTERAAALAAVDTACRRMPRADVVIGPVAEALRQWPSADRPELMKVLGAVGGKAALEIIATAAVEGSPELQDAATRELGQWMTPDAAPYLYEIAASDHRYKTRALRGYIRIARQLNMSDAERLAMARKALEIAERKEERELVLDVLKRSPSPETIELASSLLEDAQLRDHAVEAALFIGERIKDQDPEAAKTAGQKVLQVAEQGEFADRARALTSP